MTLGEARPDSGEGKGVSGLPEVEWVGRQGPWVRSVLVGLVISVGF